MRGGYEVVLIKELKARELYGFAENIRLIGISFQSGRTPPVHIHNDLDGRIQHNLPEVFHHPLREAVYHQHLRRQTLLSDKPGKMLHRKIDVVRREMANTLTRRQVV